MSSTEESDRQRPVAELSYTEASRELDEIVGFFEQRDVDVDQLVGRLERATAIVDELDRRLRRTRTQVEELVPRLRAAGAEGPPADESRAEEPLPSEPPEDDELVEAVYVYEEEEVVVELHEEPRGAGRSETPGLF